MQEFSQAREEYRKGKHTYWWVEVKAILTKEDIEFLKRQKAHLVSLGKL